MVFFLKYFLTVYVCILVPVYWRHYGAQNFLWLSDVGLFLTVLALWLNSSLLISIAVILILPLEVVWMIDFVVGLIAGKPVVGLVDYMFDRNNPLWIRLLSLFHIFLPVIWLYCLMTWGYDLRALWYGAATLWAVLAASYYFTDPSENINWVYMPLAQQWSIVQATLWYVLLFLGIPLLILWPVHSLFLYYF